MCTHNICFEQKYEKSQKFSTENCHFYSRKNSCILHRRIFVMTDLPVIELEYCSINYLWLVLYHEYTMCVVMQGFVAFLTQIFL